MAVLLGGGGRVVGDARRSLAYPAPRGVAGPRPISNSTLVLLARRAGSSRRLLHVVDVRFTVRVGAELDLHPMPECRRSVDRRGGGGIVRRCGRVLVLLSTVLRAGRWAACRRSRPRSPPRRRTRATTPWPRSRDAVSQRAGEVGRLTTQLAELDSRTDDLQAELAAQRETAEAALIDLQSAQDAAAAAAAQGRRRPDRDRGRDRRPSTRPATGSTTSSPPPTSSSSTAGRSRCSPRPPARRTWWPGPSSTTPSPAPSSPPRTGWSGRGWTRPTPTPPPAPPWTRPRPGRPRPSRPRRPPTGPSPRPTRPPGRRPPSWPPWPRSGPRCSASWTRPPPPTPGCGPSGPGSTSGSARSPRSRTPDQRAARDGALGPGRGRRRRPAAAGRACSG